jgi:uncharacterized protein Smg (DUF494 family)
MPEKPLTETELKKRRKDVEGAMASVEQEGFVFEQEEIDRLNLLAEGIITFEEHRQMINERVKRWRKEHPEDFWGEK